MISAPPDQNPLHAADACFRRGDDQGAIGILLRALPNAASALRLREWAIAERRLDIAVQALQALAHGSSVEAEVGRAIELQLRQQADAALLILQNILRTHPNLATAHHHAGRALQNLGRGDEARRALQHALRLQPDYAEAWYSLAHIERASGRLDEAVIAYHAALRLMPGLRVALLNLGITLSALEQADAALAPFEQLLQLDPEHVDAWINKGLCLHILGRMQDSQQAYERALQAAPGHPLAHFYLGCLLNEQMATAPARKHLEAAVAGNPDDADALTELAGLLEQTNDLETAAIHIERGLARSPQHPGLNLEASRLARRQGRLTEADERLARIAVETLPSRLAQQYWFEYGQLQDRAGNFSAAMTAFERGNQLAAQSPRRRQIDRAAFPRHCDAIAQWLAQGAAGAQAQISDPPAALGFWPAFLVGFPRSGTTLLDTMLDAHPQVSSIEERATIEVAVDALGAYPQFMSMLNPESLARAQDHYRAATAAYLAEGFAGLVLDKLPLRMLRVPLIRRLFPAAPIIFAVRHPCDVVLSNFMQQYAPNEAFVHFDTLADSARMYDRIMRLWRQMLEQLSIDAHWVRYESLVADPEAELTAVCAALDLDVRAEMLDSAQRLKGRSRIQTNSYQQVAEPIYRRAAGRWRNYLPWLEPVLPLLRPHIECLGYDELDVEQTP